MVDESLEDDDFGIDLDSYRMDRDEKLEEGFINLEDYKKDIESGKEATWGETIGDWFTQAGRGALKLFTWPADVLKLAMIGEGLSDLDDVEEAFRRAGKPFDREAYIRTVLDQSKYIPTQDLLEQGLESLTGMSLQPKSESGKRVKQGVEIAGFARGSGLGKALLQAGVGVGTTEALKQAGVGEEKAELLGDLSSLSPSILKKAPKEVPKVAKDLEKTALQYALPFKEFMVRERSPILKGSLSKKAESRLKEQFNVSTKEAIDKIVEGKIPIRRLREKGVNLDAMADTAYEQTRSLAKANPKEISTEDIVKNIDKRIEDILALAPSPSDAQKTAIKVLQNERDILSVSKPSSEQLINQHMNYNSDMKSIYRKAEFSGKEDEVRKAYEFLKDELVGAMSKQGNAEAAESFKAANKIYSEKMKLEQSESILEKAFKDGYSPKKLEKVLHSKGGKYLRRNMGKEAVSDIEEIAKYGKEAQERMDKFLDLSNASVSKEIQSWGQLAPMVFFPHKVVGAGLGIMKYIAQPIQGKLLTRDATRKIYKLTLKHAAEGSFNLLKKDFINLEKEISKEWGSVDNFVDATMEEI